MGKSKFRPREGLMLLLYNAPFLLPLSWASSVLTWFSEKWPPAALCLYPIILVNPAVNTCLLPRSSSKTVWADAKWLWLSHIHSRIIVLALGYCTPSQVWVTYPAWSPGVSGVSHLQTMQTKVTKGSFLTEKPWRCERERERKDGQEKTIDVFSTYSDNFYNHFQHYQKNVCSAARVVPAPTKCTRMQGDYFNTTDTPIYFMSP